MTGVEALKPNLKISFPVYHVMTSNQKACDLNWENREALSPNVDNIRNPTKYGKRRALLYDNITCIHKSKTTYTLYIMINVCCSFLNVYYYLKISHLLNCATLISLSRLYCLLLLSLFSGRKFSMSY